MNAVDVEFELGKDRGRDIEQTAQIGKSFEYPRHYMIIDESEE